jgi:hypothetical protein
MIVLFNCTGSLMTLLVNAGRVQAPDPLTWENGFRPFSTHVDLAKFPVESVFGLGPNWVDIRFRNVNPPLPSCARFEPRIPEGSIRDDYALFIFANGASLMRPSGEPVEDFHWGDRERQSQDGSPDITPNFTQERN